MRKMRASGVAPGSRTVSVAVDCGDVIGAAPGSAANERCQIVIVIDDDDDGSS